MDEDVGFHVERGIAGLKDFNLRTFFLQNHQHPQCLRLGDI